MMSNRVLITNWHNIKFKKNYLRIIFANYVQLYKLRILSNTKPAKIDITKQK